MKTTTATITDIKTGNPRMCLMPIRYLGRCFECPNLRTKKGICESAIIDAEKLKRLDDLTAEKKRLKARLKEIEQEEI